MTTDTLTTDTYVELGHLFAGVLEQGLRVTGSGASVAPAPALPEPVVITGAALGLPGVPRVFDDANIERILDGQQFIDSIPLEFREQQADMHITRLVKRETGDPTFEPIDDAADVVKLAGRHAPLDVVEQFGIDPARDAALDSVTRLAIGAGFDAMRDAGIPLVDALQDHQPGLAAARAVGTARRPARRHRGHLRLRLPGLHVVRPRPPVLLHRSRAA